MRTLLAATALLVPLTFSIACDEAAGGLIGGPGGGEGEGEGGEGEGEPVVDKTPYLDELAAQQVGRSGADLRIHAIGRDADGDAVALAVRLFDEHGDDVPAFDADFDGVPESGASVVPLDALPADASAPDVVVTLAGLYAVERQDASPIAVASLQVAFVDATGEASAALVVDVTPQPVRGEGEACDAAFIADRCAEGFGCKGAPATTCQPGGPPVIDRVAYYPPAGADAGIEGPRFLVQGVDEDGDATSLALTLYDAAGDVVALDTDGDNIDDATEFVVDLAAQPNGGAVAGVAGGYFASLAMGVGLEDVVAAVHVVAVDAAGLASAESVAPLAAMPQRGAGQVCSALGFDACTAGTVCSASAGSATSTTTCQATSVMRTQVCNSAPHVDVVAGAGQSVEGTASGASLWDAPSGCSPNDPKSRPEGVVVLQVSSSIATLTLSTDVPATGFDTVMYVESSCDASAPAPALVCGDDGDGTVCSSVTLHDVAPGTYAVVVDSYGPDGGHFGLAIDAE